MAKTNGNFYKKSLQLAFISILCQTVNLVRDVFLAKSLGASNLNDIYLISQSTISMFVSMVNSPLATAYVPVTTEYFVSKDKRERNKFISKVYGDIFILSLAIMVISYLFINPITQMVAPGYEGSDKIILIKMILLQMPIVSINMLRGINRGNFQILQKYNISEVTNVIPYCVMVLYLIIFNVNSNIYIIGIILTVTTFISIIPELIILRKNGVEFKMSIGITNDIKIMIKMMLAPIIVTAVREVNVVTDKAFGSMLEEGSITMLSYGSKITVVFVSLVSTAISVVGFTDIARLKNQNDKKGVLNIIEKSSNIINLIIIPLAFYLIVFSNDVIKILFERGNFTSAQTNITANIMRCYAIGLLGYGFQDVFTRALHAYKIVRCTIKASIMMVIINIILDFLFFKSIGSYGIALASSLAILCVIPMLSRDVIRYIGKFSIKLIVSEIIKIVAASVVATISVIFIKKLLIDNFMTFIILSILYMIIYFIICIILKVNIFKEILKNRMEF